VTDRSLPLPAPFAAPTPARAVVAAHPAAARALRIAAATWATVAVLGQLWMAVYIAVLYGGSALRGDFAAWNRVLPHGLVDGEPVANAVLFSHLGAAAVVYVAGGLQLWPWLRRHAPRVHRWSGRTFLVASVTIALGGVSMKFLHGRIGDSFQEAALLFAAGLIVWFATQAYRTARARRFDVHRRWALRLWLAMGTVWFLRLGVFGWIMANGGRIVGFDAESFSGPALVVIVWGAVLVPQAVLHAYFRAQARPTAVRAGTLAATLALLTLLTLGAMAAEALAMSWPRTFG
jgi:hypothetical protein